MEREGGVVVRGLVEIDTRQPFRSVKEAVVLFGEKVLAREVYGNKVKEMQAKASEKGEHHQSRIGAVAAELEETNILKKTEDEGNFMAYYLASLEQNLEDTKRELHKLKARESSHNNKQARIPDPEIEELKFMEEENATKFEEKRKNSTTQLTEEDGMEYFEKKRSVKFAGSPSLTNVIVNREDAGEDSVTTPLKRKTRRNPLIPLIGRLFSRKKASQEGVSPRS